MRRRVIGFSLALALSGCASYDPTCGEGTDPVIVTGLSGIIDTTTALEIELRVPETCEVVARTWTFWDESADTATLAPEPPEGRLHRADIDVGDDIIVFRDSGLGVRLDYPNGMVGPELTLTWFAEGMDLSSVDCDGTSGALECTVRAP